MDSTTAGRFKMIKAEAKAIGMQRSWVEDHDAGKRILTNVAMGLVKELKRNGYVFRVYIVDLTDKRDVRRAVARTGTQGCGNDPLKACP